MKFIILDHCNGSAFSWYIETTNWKTTNKKMFPTFSRALRSLKSYAEKNLKTTKHFADGDVRIFQTNRRFIN